jgi:hypothetical protein
VGHIFVALVLRFGIGVEVEIALRQALPALKDGGDHHL